MTIFSPVVVSIPSLFSRLHKQRRRIAVHLPRAHTTMSTEWKTTRLSVGEINALITTVSVVVSYCMSLMLGSVSLEIRRLMTIRGKRDAIIQDEGYRSMWNVFASSRIKLWTFLAALPVLLNRAASTLIEFTTSGVSASTGYVQGAEVQVLGLVGGGVHEEPTFPTIDGLVAAAEGGVSLETAYLTLLSSELASLGFSSSFSDVEVGYEKYTNTNDVGYEEITEEITEERDFYYSSEEGEYVVFVSEEGVFVSGNQFEPELTVSINFCVEVAVVTDEPDEIALAECREGLIVDQASREFDVVYKEGVEIEFTSMVCSTLYHDIALGNQGLGIVERDFEYSWGGDSEDTEPAEVGVAEATCASIYESIIESCVWQQDGVLYFGDWNVGSAGECDDDLTGFPDMAVVGIVYEPEVEQGSDAASLLASMTAEVFSGTARLYSRQQLVDILGAMVRLESMERSLQTAYAPVEVVEIGVSTWVPVVLLLALLLPAMVWGLVKWHSRGTKMFLPVSPAEWSACAARELAERGKEDGALLLRTAKPLDEHYDQVYAFGPVEGADEKRFLRSQQQRLGWVHREAVTPATTEKLAPMRSYHMRGGGISARAA